MMKACSIEDLTFASLDDVLALVSAFEACSLPRERWTHKAHLTVACWYLLNYARPLATRLTREGIKRYNEAKGIMTTATGGYHETMTLFWIHVVHAHLCSISRTTSLTLFNELIARCNDKRLPFEYYSRERLMSWEARTRWVEPDLKALE